MPKRAVQPIRDWNTDAKPTKENCPNRAVLDPSVLPHGMTYRPLRRKAKPIHETDSTEEPHHETTHDLPTTAEDAADD